MIEILEHLIDVDKECQEELKKVQEKQENIEYLIEHELLDRKEKIKNTYQFKKDMGKSEYERKLAENLGNLEQEKKQQIEEWQAKFEKERRQMTDDIIVKIKNEVE